MNSDGIEFDWRTWTDFKQKPVCSRILLEPTVSNNNRTRHTGVSGLLHDREFDCVTEDIVRETNTKNIYFFHELSHRKKPSNIVIFLQLLLIAVRYRQWLQRAWYQLQSIEFPQNNSTFSISCLWAQAVFPHLN